MFKKFRPEKKENPQAAAAGQATETSESPVKAVEQAAPPVKQEDPLPPPLTPQQLAQVREVALKKARQLKLSETNARLLADTIIGGLAVAQVG
jgi:hypothetical protein